MDDTTINSSRGLRILSMLNVGKSQVELVRLDTLAPQFMSEFERYKAGFLDVLAHSYRTYYGDEYHLNRIVEGQSVVYFALADGNVVAASYVKRNLRRGGTTVYPEAYRSIGLGKALVTASFADFPAQYSILEVSNSHMLHLLLSVGFTRASSVEQARNICKEEFNRLCEFETTSDGIVFRRQSERRTSVRDALTLLFRDII